MPTFERAITIRAPIDLVFAAITDPLRGPEWNPNIVEVRNLSSSNVGVGTRWQQVAMVAGRSMTLTCTIVEFHPPHDGVLEISGPQRALIRTRCSAADGATRVVQVVDFVPPGGMLGRMASGLIQRELEREVARGLERQRDLLEAEARQQGQPG